MIVVKYGGHAMEDSQGHFAQSIKNVIASGESCVIVHGGGPQIDAALKAANIPSEFVGGFRVTTKEILAVATDVLNNQIQPKIIEQLESAGLSGGRNCWQPSASSEKTAEVS
jgi:acetylglutamate kinase